MQGGEGGSSSTPFEDLSASEGTVMLRATDSRCALERMSSRVSCFFFRSFFGMNPRTCRWLLQYLEMKNKFRNVDISTLQRGICATYTESYAPTVLRLGDGVRAPLAIVLGHIFTLLEGGCLVLQDMPDAESIAI